MIAMNYVCNSSWTTNLKSGDDSRITDYSDSKIIYFTVKVNICEGCVCKYASMCMSMYRRHIAGEYERDAQMP